VDWNAVGAIGESVGAGLLFISIVYLAVQVRLAKRVVAVEAAQRVRAAHHDVYAALATNRDFAEVVVEKHRNFTDANELMLWGYYQWLVSNWENQYELFRQGLVDIVIMRKTISSFERLVGQPKFVEFWKQVRVDGGYSQDLVRFLDASLSAEQKALLDN
jgi:hypothetical protein